MAGIVPTETVVVWFLLLSLIVTPLVVVSRRKTWGRRKLAAVLCLALYLPFLLGIAVGEIPFGDPEPRDIGPSWNLVPLASIRVYWERSGSVALRQMGGNVLLFAPLGFLLPFLSSRFRRLRSLLLVALVVSVSVELTQILISLAIGQFFRAADMDDVLLNLVGADLGWMAWRVLPARMRGEMEPAAG